MRPFWLLGLEEPPSDAEAEPRRYVGASSFGGEPPSDCLDADPMRREPKKFLWIVSPWDWTSESGLPRPHAEKTRTNREIE